MNTDGLWPFVWVGVSVVLTLLIQHLITKFQAWRVRDKYTLSQKGMLKITPEAIRCLKRSKVPGPKDYFPSKLWEYIQPSTALTLSRLVMRRADAFKIGHPDNTEDICRALTIAAAMYDKWIPVTLTLLDGRTREYFEAVENELGRYTYAEPSYRAVAATASLEVMERARAIKPHVQTVGQHLFIHLTVYENYVSFECFAEGVQSVVKKKSGMNLTHAEIMALVNAFSAMSGTRIPKQYHNPIGLTDPASLTAALIYYRPPAKLKVVGRPQNA